MTKDLRTFSTLSPISSPLNVLLGIDQSSEQYQDMLIAISNAHPNSIPIHFEKKGERHDYDDIDVDARDHRLLLWKSKECPDLKIHVFANNISVAELTIAISNDITAREAEKLCQIKTIDKLKLVYQSFLDDLTQIEQSEKNSILQIDVDNTELKVHWVARTLLLNSEEVKESQNQIFLKRWLKNTQRPEDAFDLIAGNIKYSLSWLNYVVIDAVDNDPQISTMILAQYFYTAQENCNNLLKQAIDSAYNEDKLSVAEKKLSTSRVLSRLHQIDFYEHKKYLNRFKRKLLDEILTCWDFEQLSDNSTRMIEICSSRLEEADNKKRERSTVMTDLLLVTLSFFAVFELSLYLTELSREMMSRPALAYNDERSSFFLNLIAGVDVDIMFVFGFVLTLALVYIYKRIKSK
jgi:hypothetical protein